MNQQNIHFIYGRLFLYRKCSSVATILIMAILILWQHHTLSTGFETAKAQHAIITFALLCPLTGPLLDLSISSWMSLDGAVSVCKSVCVSLKLSLV